jgi:energy-coupling factor transporter transmembrane protein EcfT
MNQDLVDEKIFYEIQQFRQIWIWLIILIIVIVLYIPIISGVLNIFLSIIFFLFGFGFIWLFYSMKLVTEVKEAGIQITFTPFTNFIIPFNEIKNLEIREYRPILEYGGWGIRFNRTGKAYTVSGKIGLQVELFNGKKILIGTEKSDDLLKSLDNLIKV